MYPQLRHGASSKPHQYSQAVHNSFAHNKSQPSVFRPHTMMNPTKDSIAGLSYELSYDGLSNLQKRVLLRQTEDIRSFNKNNNWFLVKVHRSQTVALLNSVARLFFRLLLLSGAWPWAVITQSEYSFRHPAYFAVVYVGLFVTSVLYLICHALNIFTPLIYLLYGNGVDWSLAKWLNTRIFDSQDKIMSSAKSTFANGQVHSADRFQSPKNMNPRSDKHFDFSVDVAKSILLMCAAVYERDRSWVKEAITKSNEPMQILLRLLKSEEPAHRLAHRWGLEFVSIADFDVLGGPFAGVFYQHESLDQEQNPFAILVTKGTSYDVLFEHLAHASCNLESSTGILPTSTTHADFFKDMFPCNASAKVVTPYMRIIDTLKLVASKAREETGKPTNLFIGGHALGAGIASYLYARLLEKPADLGGDIVLKDVYTYGTVRDCDLYPVVMGNHSNESVGPSREMWKVVNRARSAHLGEQLSPSSRVGKLANLAPNPGAGKSTHVDHPSQGLRADAVMGVRINLTPYSSSPPFCNLPDGFEVTMHDENPHQPIYLPGRDSYEIGMQLLALFTPILHDLFPPNYMLSLCKLGPHSSQEEEAISPPPPIWHRSSLPGYQVDPESSKSETPTSNDREFMTIVLSRDAHDGIAGDSLKGWEVCEKVKGLGGSEVSSGSVNRPMLLSGLRDSGVLAEVPGDRFTPRHRSGSITHKGNSLVHRQPGFIGHGEGSSGRRPQGVGLIGGFDSGPIPAERLIGHRRSKSAAYEGSIEGLKSGSTTHVTGLTGTPRYSASFQAEPFVGKIQSGYSVHNESFPGRVESGLVDHGRLIKGLQSTSSVYGGDPMSHFQVGFPASAQGLTGLDQSASGVYEDASASRRFQSEDLGHGQVTIDGHRHSVHVEHGEGSIIHGSGSGHGDGLTCSYHKYSIG